MRQTINNKNKHRTIRANRYSDTRSSQYNATRLSRYNAASQTVEEETDLSRFSEVRPITSDRYSDKKKGKRRLHWIERIVIALASVIATVFIGFLILITIDFFNGANQPHTATYAHLNGNENLVPFYDGADEYNAENESYSENGNNIDVDNEAAIGDFIDISVTDEIVDDALYNEIYTVSEIEDSDTYDVNSTDDADESNSQIESGFLGSDESSHYFIDDRIINYVRQFDFFLESKLYYYIAFYYENPNLSYECIVWKVNAGLNRDFFEDPYTISDPHPFLVNPFNRLPYDFTPSGMQRIDGTDMLATPETISAFIAFQAYAREHGHELRVASAYRSISNQRSLYANRGHLGTIARPGHSEHHTGRAIDLWGPLGLLDRWQRYPTSETALWVADNAYRFGFIIRYTIDNDHITGIVGEPWHITYVTEHVSRTMRNNGYGSLEEFVARNPSFVFRP